MNERWKYLMIMALVAAFVAVVFLVTQCIQKLPPPTEVECPCCDR